MNCLNDHFSSVGEKLIPNPHSNFDADKISHFVGSKIEDNSAFSLYTITREDVFTALTNLDVNKATGIDEVGPKILKISRSVIGDSLAPIINLSVCTGIFPNILKNAISYTYF